MTLENGMEKPIQGDSFSTHDSLSRSFPSLNIKEVRRNIEIILKKCEGNGYTGIQESAYFDEHGLIIGTQKGSIFSELQIRAREDIEEFMTKIGEGSSFDGNFSFDAEKRKAVFSFTTKRHQQKPNMLILSDEAE